MLHNISRRKKNIKENRSTKDSQKKIGKLDKNMINMKGAHWHLKKQRQNNEASSITNMGAVKDNWPQLLTWILSMLLRAYPLVLYIIMELRSWRCHGLVAMVTIRGLWLAKHCNKRNSKTKCCMFTILGYIDDVWVHLHTKPWSRICNIVAMATGNRPY